MSHKAQTRKLDKFPGGGTKNLSVPSSPTRGGTDKNMVKMWTAHAIKYKRPSIMNRSKPRIFETFDLIPKNAVSPLCDLKAKVRPESAVWQGELRSPKNCNLQCHEKEQSRNSVLNKFFTT